MIRRPLAAAAAAFGAGTAIQHLASGPLERAALALTAACLLCLLFYFVLRCKNIENKGLNGSLTAKNGSGCCDNDENSNVNAALHQYAEAAAVPAECEEADGERGSGSAEDADSKARAEDVRSAVIKFAFITVIFVYLGAAAGYSCEHRVSQFNDAYKSEITLNGMVKSVSIGADDKCSLVFEARSFISENEGAESVIHLKKPEKLMVYVSDIDGRDAVALTGRAASVSGTVSRPDGASNPGAFDYSLYLLSKDIRVTLRADASQLAASEDSPRGLRRLLNIIAVFKYDYEQRILARLDDRSGQMLLGILFGDDSFMDDELKTSFQQNGLAHLLAASGLHVGFVYGLFNVLMRKPTTVSGNIPVMAVLVVYAALAGFSASVVRAVFMIIVHIVGRVTHRRYDFLTCISFCALALLIWQPANIFSSGFQLSFAAVLTLSVVMKKAEQITGGLYRAAGDRKGPVIKLFVEPFAGMIALQLGMMPLTVRNFHYVSFGGLFLNIPAIALAGLIVPIGVILIPLAYIGGPAFMFVGNMEEMLVKLLLMLNDALAGTPLSYRYAASPPTWAFIMYYAALFFLCSETGRGCVKSIKKYGKKAVAVPLLACAALAAGCGCVADMDYMLSDMIFVDVGQGDCAHLKAGRGVDIMFDSGGSEKKDVGMETLMPYFLGNGVSNIDIAVVSHLHTDHYGGLLTLKDAVKIKRLALSAVYESQSDEIYEQTGVPPENMMFLKAGDIVDAGGGVKLYVLAPAAGSREEYAEILENTDDENKLSLIVRAEYKGRSALFTGDIDSEYEKTLVDIYGSTSDGSKADNRGYNDADGGSGALRADMLKIAHHGSKHSSCSEFLEAVAPSVSVIQVGLNLYGHPTPEALERIEEQGSMMFRNDQNGAVMISLGRRMKVRTMK